MTARRMLFGAIGSYPAPAALAVTALTTAPAGGWVQVVHPRASYHVGYTYFGYVRGDNGNCEVRYYKHSDQTTSAATVLHAALGVDTHDDPAIFVRDDAHLMAFYTKHATEDTIYVRVSVNTLDSDPTLSGGFAAETTIHHGTHQTYCSVAQLTGETNSPIYLFTRDTVSGDTISHLAETHSNDGGATWSSQVAVMTKTPDLYWCIYSNGVDRIDFALSDGNGVSSDPVSMYHMYLSGGAYHKSDGTPISASQPFAPTDATLVYASATAGPGWMTGIGRDGSGNIAVTYEVATHRTGGLADQYSLRYAYFNGSSWASGVITTSDDTGLIYVTHSCLDESSINTAYVAKAVSGVFEMSKYVTADNGSTWTPTTLTSGSSGTGNIYPAPIANRATDLRVLWLYGTYTSYLSNSLGIKGAG
jgi:hypothetical protein